MQKYKVVYSDFSILIVDKPQGIATTPGKINNSLCEQVFNDYSELIKIKGYTENEGGLLNRLDNETGGLVLFAKTNQAFEYYSSLMNSGKITKTYIALVNGVPKDNFGIINMPIAHHHKNKSRMVVAADGVKFRGKKQAATTNWKLLETKSNISTLEVFISKGVRHQIRVHLAYINFPIVGDKIYNKKDNFENSKMLLYACGINFYSFEKKEINIRINVPFLN